MPSEGPMTEPELLAVEAEIHEETPYFFQRIGELTFEAQHAETDAQTTARRRQRECIATAPDYGVVAAAGAKAIFVAKIDQLSSSSVRRADEEAVALADPSKTCAVRIDACYASVHISSDGLLLAVCEDSRIRTWAVRDLLSGDQESHLCEWMLGNGEIVKQFSWRPGQSSAEAAEAFVVTDTGRLLNITLGGRLASDREGHSKTVSCAAWSPDGTLLAFASGDRVIVAAADGSGTFRATARIPAAQDDDLRVDISTVAWAGAEALVLSCSLYSVDDDALEESCSVCILHWSSWQPGSGQGPSGLELVAMSEVNADPDGQPAGHYHQALISPWGVAVAAHGMANDNHIIVLEALPNQAPRSLEILDDSLAIRIPLAADYTDNFVTGLGIVLTSTEGVHHPDPEHGSLPPQPVLVVATSDGALRLFTFANLKRSAGSITHAAFSYIDAAYPVFLQAAAEDPTDTTASAEAEEQQSSDRPQSTYNNAAVSRQELVATSLPQDTPSQEESYLHSDTPGRTSREQAASNVYGRETSAEETDRAQLAASKAAAAALPESSSDYSDEGSTGSSAEDSTEESSREHAPPATPAELPVKQPQLTSIAQAAGRAAATALSDSDEETEEDLESQASVSMAPAARPHARDSAQRFGQADRGAANSQAAKSAAPGRRLGRLDSLSASEAESVEVQSRPENAEVPAPQPAKEAKPAPMPWSLGVSATAFGQVADPSGSTAAPAAAPTTPATSLFGTTVPSLTQAPRTGKPEVSTPASGAAFGMARQRSGALPAPAFGQPFSASAPQASGALPPFSPPVPRPAQAPQVPRQSAAQQAIARAREGALAAKAGTAAAGAPAAGPERPTAATGVPPSAPLPPKARLQEEGKELASMEREFLKSLAETRAIEAKLTAKMRAAEGADSGTLGTRKGALALQERVQELVDRGRSLRAQLASDRARFSALHRGWKEDRARAEALLFFNGKRDFLDEDEAVYASEDVDLVIQELVASVQQQLPLLQKQAAQLSDGIEALKARAQQHYQDGPLAVQQLYNALNLQRDVALSQVARVQRLWEKVQELGLSDSEAFDSLPQLHSHGTPAEAKKSSRSPYVRVSRSPWSQIMAPKSPLLVPGSSSALASKSPWAGDSAAAMRALLLEKVSYQEGGIRLTTIQQTSRVATTPAPRTTDKSPARPREKVPILSTLRLYEDSERPRSPITPGSEQHGEQLHPPTLGSHGQTRSAVPHRGPGIVSEEKDSPAHRKLVVAPSSAQQRALQHDSRAASPSPLEKAAKVSRSQDHTGPSARSPGAAQSSKPTSAMPGNANSSASKTTPKTSEGGTSAKSVPNQSSQSAAKMPPVPSKAALAAAHARTAAAITSMNTRPKLAAPGSQHTAAESAGGAAHPPASAVPARKAAAMPPVPSKAALAAAQAQGQAMLSGQKAKAAPAKMPPMPSKAALAAAQAQGEAALNANKHKAAEQEVSCAPQINILSVGSGAASSSGQAAPLSFSLALSASPAALAFGASSSSKPFASLSFGPATGAPSSRQLASSIAAPPPAGGAFSFGNAAVATPAAPAPMASAMSVQQPAALPAASLSAPPAFPGLSAGPSSQTASSSSAAPSAALNMSEASKPAENLAAGFSAFGGLGQQASATPAPASSPFGKGLSFSLSATPAPGTTGALSFGMTPSASLSVAPSTFGGALAASSPASPFPAFGQPTSASPAAPSAFGGFGQGTSAAGSSMFGQSISTPASSPAPFGGFGAPTGFGQSCPQSGPLQGFGGFGQAASVAPGFGTPATPGFGQTASPAFGAPATPGFGSPRASAFGAPVSPAAHFGAPASASTSGGGFAAAASQSGGFGSLAQGSNAFGAAAQQNSGGFGAFGTGQPQSGGFGAFGGAAAPSTPKAPSPQNNSMWAPRK